MIKNATGDWLKKACKFASKYDSVHSIETDEQNFGSNYIQWMSGDGKTFFPASSISKKILPGYYSIGVTQSGTPFFVNQKTGTEKLIKFPETISDTVVEEIEKFWDREAVYKEKGLAYRRGFILYGPAGAGKSSIIKIAIKNVIERGGVVFDFVDPYSFKTGLGVFREIQPETPVIVLMEDVDAILSRNNESEILNILDGVVPISNTIFIATTNYPERLGARIMNRPSRFDKRFEIGMPNAESRKIYLKSIAGKELKADEVNQWVKDTDGFAIAHLKELFVSVNILGYKYKDAIDTLRGQKTKVYSDEYMEGTLPVRMLS